MDLAFCKVPVIEFQVFGAFSLSGKDLNPPKLPKACRQLFGLLVLSGESGVHRRTAASWIWPEVPDITARFYLRRTIMQCRQALGQYADLLHSSGSDVIRLCGDISSDYKTFEHLCSLDNLDSIVEAYDLSSREFLAEIQSNWLSIQRMKLSLLRRDICLRAVRSLRQNGEFTSAISILRSSQETDPFDEEVLVQLWSCLVETGAEVDFRKSYSKTLTKYRKAGIELTERLHQEARKHFAFLEGNAAFSRDSRNVTNSLTPVILESFPDLRDAETRRVIRDLRACRVVAISGPPGSGKTVLALKVAARLGWP